MDRVDAAELPRNRRPPLLPSLKAARASFERENQRAGADQLRAFPYKVRGPIARSDPALADEPIRAAEGIILRSEKELR